MSDFVPPTVPCLDPVCRCCDEWIETDRAMRAHYVAELNAARRLTETLWQQARRMAALLDKEARRD